MSGVAARDRGRKRRALMIVSPPVQPDFNRRWEHLLAMISEERGWAEPADREYPESDDSCCWPMPYTPIEGMIPGSVQRDMLSGQVVIVEANWEFGSADTAVVPRLHAAAGWIREVEVVAGRIPRLRAVDFLPLTAISDGGIPEEMSPREALSGGVESMLAYYELLARSALAGVQFPAAYDGVISTAATEVSELALACGELARWEDLDLCEVVARQELATWRRLRRSYVWFDAESSDEDFGQVPTPVRRDLLESTLEHLAAPRTHTQVLALPLRSLTFGEEPTAAGELDSSRHGIGAAWNSLGTSDVHEDATAPAATARTSNQPGGAGEVLDVTRLFTAAIETAMDATKLGRASDSAERHRARHEAVAQHLLDHILRQPGELEQLLEVIGVQCRNTPALYTEWEDWETRSRFDHVVDDHRDLESYRSVLVIEDKIDAQLGTDQLDRYCEFLAAEQGQGTVLVLHPERNPLTSQKLRISELESAHRGVTVRFMTWTKLSVEMITKNPAGEHAALWQALAEFAESVGTGDISHLPPAQVLLDPDVAAELRDLFLTMQAVADKVGHRAPRQLRFSFHKGNSRPWLQMGLSNSKRAGAGLELDLVESPGTLLAGVHGPLRHESLPSPAKIGVFVDGELSAAASRRAERIAETSRRYRDGDTDGLADALTGRGAGNPPSPEAQDALRLLGAIFQAQAIRNPHRGGADGSRTEGVNEESGAERLGAKLVRADVPGSAVHLFIGPPEEQSWDRASLWIRDPSGEREILPLEEETGRDYVLRVWRMTREALDG
ncbi:PD-(D/E)XK nuclease family protein [Brachybacterium paraconglomeratum]|uniref:PD-(D/E)XK nuclease family protein n=1 Tax=Brachybacterium paraconglomeratum TaxID=173362 RepID=UPI00111078DE|nr:PD-(D/E)XK nuclease family protein [Brachybacterium paraconglomeratum]